MGLVSSKCPGVVGVAEWLIGEDEREDESNVEDITIYLNRSANSDEACDPRKPAKMGSSRDCIV